jgi:hypothetical protein
LTLPLELMRTELIEMLVAPNTIVETLDVIEDFRLGLSPCESPRKLDRLSLEQLEAMTWRIQK